MKEKYNVVSDCHIHKLLKLSLMRHLIGATGPND